MKTKFYMVRWEIDKHNMPNNYVAGYEVFTNKIEAEKEVEYLKKIHFFHNLKINEYHLKPWELSEIVSSTELSKPVKMDYGYVHNSGFQFH